VRNLHTLKPGDRFVIPGLEKKGTLLTLTPSSARVRYDGVEKEETFTTRYGERVTFKKSTAEETNISLTTQVEKLKKRRKA